MIFAICTLFERDFHYGTAVLANSLAKSGFEGEIFAGFRGDLPPWASEAENVSLAGFEEAWSLFVSESVRLVLIRLTTAYHFTNYKPEFMLALLDGPARESEGLIYFDPDIVVAKAWSWIRDWVSCGVALAEDVNSPLPRAHPRRMGWRQYIQSYKPSGLATGDYHVNGGFCGVRKEHRAFLELWRKILEEVCDVAGSKTATKIEGGDRSAFVGFFACLDTTDQDALNMALETYSQEVSLIGREAMAFKPGLGLIPHALGSAKPWRRRYLADALVGKPPRVVDKAYWAAADGPLRPYSASQIRGKRNALQAAALIGRFLRRT